MTLIRNTIQTQPIPLKRAVISPDIHICPRCFETTGIVTEIQRVIRQVDAGGWFYRWESYLGWLACDDCGYVWSENWS